MTLAGTVACAWDMLLTAALRVIGRASMIGTVAVATTLPWPPSALRPGALPLPSAAGRRSEHASALNGAWAGAQTEAGVIDAVTTGEAEMRAASKMESEGGAIRGTGAGNGPAAKLLAAAADGYAQLAARMQNERGWLAARTGICRRVAPAEPLNECNGALRLGDVPLAWGSQAGELGPGALHRNGAKSIGCMHAYA